MNAFTLLMHGQAVLSQRAKKMRPIEIGARGDMQFYALGPSQSIGSRKKLDGVGRGI